MIVCNYVNFIGLLCVTFERRPCGRTRRTFLITKISYAAERRTLIKEIFLYLKSVKLEEHHALPWSLSAASPLMPSFTSPSCFSPSSCELWRFLASAGFAREPSLSLFAFLRSRPQSLSFPDDWPQPLVPWPSPWRETPPCRSFSHAPLCHGFIACLLCVSALVKISIPSTFCRVLCLTGLTRVLALYFVCAPKIF